MTTWETTLADSLVSSCSTVRSTNGTIAPGTGVDGAVDEDVDPAPRASTAAAAAPSEAWSKRSATVGLGPDAQGLDGLGRLFEAAGDPTLVAHVRVVAARAAVAGSAP